MTSPLRRMLLVVFCVVAAVLYWQYRDTVTEDRGRLETFRHDDAIVLYWPSTVEVPFELRLREAFDLWKGETGRFVLALNSPGGALREGNRVIELIRRMQQTHRVDTFVGAQQECLSMCVPIFLQGNERIAAASSAWMFHEPRRVNFISGKDEGGLESEQRFFAERFFERHFVNSPMNRAWREQLQREWVGKDVWRSGQDLVAENSGIITSLRLAP